MNPVLPGWCIEWRASRHASIYFLFQSKELIKWTVLSDLNPLYGASIIIVSLSFNPRGKKEMLDPEVGYGDELLERVPSILSQEPRAQAASLDVRRRIEHMREIKRLRELLDDPDFNELS